MSGPSRIPAPPITPGEVLRESVLVRFGITQDRLADALGVSRFSVNQIVNSKRAVTSEMALRLARVTSTSPEFWLNLQRDTDIYEARRRLGKVVLSLKVLQRPNDANDKV
jgi:addiction module HigA family antidote